MEDPTPPDDVARLRAAIQRADAPAALRLQVARQIAEARERRARARKIAAGVLVAGGALAAGLALFVLSGPSPPSVAQVVRVAAQTPHAPAPSIDPAEPRRLAAHVDRVWFPSWRRLRWRAIGRSRRTVGGRPAVTVYYARDDGARIAYTIVGGGTLPWPEDTRAVTRGW